MWVMPDEEGRIGACTDIKEYADGMIEVEAPESFDINRPNNWVYRNGSLFYEPQEEPNYKTIENYKSLLEETDYVAIKMSELNILGTQIPDVDIERYKKVLKLRSYWREEISRLEATQ